MAGARTVRSGIRRTACCGGVPYFRKLLMTHVLLAGNGFAFIRRDNAGSPNALLPLDPELTTARREEGEPLTYETQVGFEKIRLPARDVLHIHGCGWGGHDGWHMVNKAKESLGVGIAARDFGGRFFGNNAYPGGVLRHPAVLKDTAKKALRESWESMHQGIEAAHRTAILEEGMEFQKVGHTAEESQLLELRRHEIREVANWFGIPPHKLGDDTKTSFSSLEQENQQYLNDALDGWLSTWESECRDKLFTEKQKGADSHVVEFLRAALVRADIKTRYEAYKIAIMHGILSPDEARDLENLNPIPDGKGDVYLTPANLKELGEEPEVEPNPPPPQVVPPPALPAPDDEDARKALLADLNRRIVRRVWSQAKRASHKPDKFVDWIETIAARNMEHIKGICEPVLPLCDVGETADVYALRALDLLQTELLEISGRAKPDTLCAVLDGEYERLESAVCNGDS
jgi:HK97 family phage portal protein